MTREELRKAIETIEDPKMREVERRTFELEERVKVTDHFSLTTKIFSLFEIYKDVYGDEITAEGILERLDMIKNNA